MENKPVFYEVPAVLGLCYKIIQYDDKYYSFGVNANSFSGIWDEIKGKLNTLEELEVDEESIKELQQYKVSE